jgi:uncharacterized protein
MQHKHTNSLINETSPYLLQHAHNPVQWHAWSPEALQKAQQQNKPILVSIGYAACHWCHVMEKESFENEAVAQKMNEYFINIKIDREERPDLDHIYMDAVQAISGSGGWPLNVFLTPQAKPFYGGTYFPPIKAYNRSSWADVLDAIHKAWTEKPQEIFEQADNLFQHLKQSSTFINLKATEGIFTSEHCKTITQNILKQADTVWGGFGNAPKFPQTFTIQYLLQYYQYSKNDDALNQALLSLNKMMEGGIYDSVGGGFARYSTDAEWLAPHFEKMLYDNALLLNVISDAYLVTKNESYAYTINKTITFLLREMQHAEGGFYAAIDADSEGEEGKFYVWQKAEVDSILGIDADVFCKFYDITENGNWENKNILRILKPVTAFAAENNIDEQQLTTNLQNCLQKLLQQRNTRIRPITDDKILLGWNALLVTALCKAGCALKNKQYITLAEETLQFLTQKFSASDVTLELHHTYKNNRATYPAFLDDYAYYIQACIHVQQATAKNEYLQTAANLAKYVIDNFFDEENGFFSYTHKNQQDVIMRKNEVYDGATPSGNSIMASNLSHLSFVYNITDWYKLSSELINKLGKATVNHPTSFAVWASLVLQNTVGWHQLVVVGQGLQLVQEQLQQNFLPNLTFVINNGGKSNNSLPILQNKAAGNGTMLYWCRQFECLPPVFSVENFVKAVEKWNYSKTL